MKLIFCKTDIETIYSESATENEIVEVLEILSPGEAIKMESEQGNTICTEISPITSLYWLNIADYKDDLIWCADGAIHSLQNVTKAFFYFLSADKRLYEECNLERYADEILISEASAINDSADQFNEVLKSVERLIRIHQIALQRKRSQLRYLDHYSVIQNDKWTKELDYFWLNIVQNDLGHLQGFSALNENRTTILDGFLDALPPVDIGIKEVEQLNGFEYERYCADILLNAGWKTHITAATGDQGIDIVANRDGLSIAIQCKRYSSPVGNAAVQEIIAGRVFEGTTHAAVVSNIGYTTSAKQLAARADVFLLHHDDLENLHVRLLTAQH